MDIQPFSVPMLDKAAFESRFPSAPPADAPSPESMDNDGIWDAPDPPSPSPVVEEESDEMESEGSVFEGFSTPVVEEEFDEVESEGSIFEGFSDEDTAMVGGEGAVQQSSPSSSPSPPPFPPPAVETAHDLLVRETERFHRWVRNPTTDFLWSFPRSRGGWEFYLSRLRAEAGMQ